VRRLGDPVHRKRAGAAFGGQAAHEGRGAADCSEYRQAAGAFALGSSVTPIEPIGLLAPQSDFD